MLAKKRPLCTLEVNEVIANPMMGLVGGAEMGMGIIKWCYV